MSDNEKPNNIKSNSRTLWNVFFIVLLGVVLSLKQTHLSLSGLHWDAGAVLIGVLFVAGLSGSILYGHISSSTQMLVAQGKFKLAEKGLRKGLRWHKLFGPDSIDYTKDLVLLSQVCRETEQFSDAEQFAKQAIDMLRRGDEEWTRLSNRPMDSRQAQLHALSKEFRKDNAFICADALFELAATQYELRRFKDAKNALKDATQKLASYIDEFRAPQSKCNEESNLFTKDFVLSGMQNENQKSAGAKLLLALRAISKCDRLLARIYSSEGLTEEAESAISRAKRHSRQAVEIIDKQISSKPDAQCFMLRAMFFMEVLHEYDKAVVDLNQAMEMNTQKNLKFSFLTNRGECFNRKGNLELALKDFNEAIALNSKSGATFMNRAEVYDRLGKKDLAAADKNRARELGYSCPRLDWVDLT